MDSDIPVLGLFYNLHTGRKPMRYISTRGIDGSLSFNDVLLAGLAPDGGLYVPEEYPQLTWKHIDQMKGWSYHQIAFHILRMFIDDDIDDTALRMIVEDAYNPRLFGSIDITPIQPLSKGLGLLKLSNGPTLAFKDVALQLLANLMDHVLRERDEYLNILGATSGDTGSAAEEAVRGRERLRIFMLSPFGRMTPFQQMQMYRINDPAVFNLVPNGNFDDCQSAVKLVNADSDFKERYSIGAVNSINWARIVAQVVYYIYGYTRVMNSADEIMTVSVPSGNFGNALAAYVAGKMGLRINIIVATNENDVLTEFFNEGRYRIRKGDEVMMTQSPSMDIASASNFERFMFDQANRNPQHLVQLWNQLAKKGEFQWNLNRDPDSTIWFKSGTATDDEVTETIKLVFDRTGIIIDPHTAVAAKVFYDLQSGPGMGPALIAETAQPAKFEEAIQRALGIRMVVPDSCSHLMSNEEKVTRIEETEPAVIADVVKDFIEANVN
jgi:threonine synthase